MAKRKRTTQSKPQGSATAVAVPGEIGEAANPAEGQPSRPQTTPSRKAMLAEAAERKRRRQNLMLIAAGVAVVLLVVAGVALSWRNAQPVVGESTFTSQGNVHIPLGSTSPVVYNSVPPTSGPHYENIVAWGRQPEPVRYEHLIHNLEDGGVLVYYQCPEGCPELVAELEEVLEPYLAGRRNVVLTTNDPDYRIGTSGPLHQDMGARIALTVWGKLLTMDEVDAEAIGAFVERYEGIDHH